MESKESKAREHTNALPILKNLLGNRYDKAKPGLQATSVALLRAQQTTNSLYYGQFLTLLQQAQAYVNGQAPDAVPAWIKAIEKAVLSGGGIGMRGTDVNRAAQAHISTYLVQALQSGYNLADAEICNMFAHFCLSVQTQGF